MYTVDELNDKLIDLAFAEDIGDGDHTTLCCIPDDAMGKSQLIIKEEGILAGIEMAKEVFRKFDPTMQVEVFIQDGAHVKPGDIAMVVTGKVRSLLQTERLMLNIMRRARHAFHFPLCFWHSSFLIPHSSFSFQRFHFALSVLHSALCTSTAVSSPPCSPPRGVSRSQLRSMLHGRLERPARQNPGAARQALTETQGRCRGAPGARPASAFRRSGRRRGAAPAQTEATGRAGGNRN